MLDFKVDRAWLKDITADPYGLLRGMSNRGVAHRLQRGRYFVDVSAEPFSSEMPLLDALEPLASTLLERLGMPYFLSWHTALFHYGLLEQHASTIFCAVPRVKRDAEFSGFKVRFIKLSHDRFFGIEPAREYGGTVRIATVERALLDALDRPELTAPFSVIVSAFADAASSGMLDYQRLMSYAAELRSPALARRVGFLMERYAEEDATPLQASIGSKSYFVPLRTGGGRDGEVDKRWGLRVPANILSTAEQLK